MKAICFCTRRSFHGIHKHIYENQCDLRNAAKCSEFTIIKATLPSKTLRCQLRMHWRHWQPALGHWASELLWGLQGTPTKARRIWNVGLKWTELWNEIKWVCPTWLWCYMMLYESIRTPPLVLVGRPTRWTWTSSAKKQTNTKQSTAFLFPQNSIKYIINYIIVLLFSLFGLLDYTNLPISLFRGRHLKKDFICLFQSSECSEIRRGCRTPMGVSRGWLSKD